MKNFNTYIAEKLKINKNIKIDKSFKKGDKCVCISIHKMDNEKMDLRVYPTFKILSFKSDSISYKTKRGEIVTQ